MPADPVRLNPENEEEKKNLLQINGVSKLPHQLDKIKTNLGGSNKAESNADMFQPGSYLYPFHEEYTRCGQCQSTIQIRFRCPFVNKDSESTQPATQKTSISKP